MVLYDRPNPPLVRQNAVSDRRQTRSITTGKCIDIIKMSAKQSPKRQKMSADQTQDVSDDVVDDEQDITIESTPDASHIINDDVSSDDTDYSEDDTSSTNNTNEEHTTRAQEPTLDISQHLVTRLSTFLDVVNKLSTLPEHDRVFGVELHGVLTGFLGD